MDIITLSEILYDYGILVFLLVFVIVFAVLQKTKILGSGKKNFNVVIALIMGLIVVVPHITGNYPSDFNVVNIVNQALPQVSLLAIAAIMLLILVGLFGAESRWLGSPLSGWIAILAFIFIVVIFGSAAGIFGTFSMSKYIDSDTLLMIIIILVFAVIIWYVTKEPGEGEFMAKTGSLIKDVGAYFGGGK